jgi:hypothetical protein
VYPFPEKGEAGASIDSVGSLRVDVTELKETGNGVMVSAPKEEGKGTQQHGPLDPQRFESPYVSKSSLPITLSRRPFYRSLGPRFVSGHLQTKLISPPPNLTVSTILNSILASFLAWYFFAACVGG